MAVPPDDLLRDVIARHLKRAHQEVDASAPRLLNDLGSVLRAERQAWRDEHITAFTRLLAAIKHLDEAVSLSDVLKALAKGAMTEATRVAMLLVDADRLRLWGHFGFVDAPGPGEMALGQRGPFDIALEKKQTVAIAALPAGDDTRPPFMRVPAGHGGVIVPLAVGGNVVALLYADGPERRPDSDTAPIWAEQVEILVRHAALRLENLTSLRTVEVLTSPA